MLGWSGVSDLSCLGEGVLFRSGKLLIYGYGAFFFTPKSREKLYIKKRGEGWTEHFMKLVYRRRFPALTQTSLAIDDVN